MQKLLFTLFAFIISVFNLNAIYFKHIGISEGLSQISVMTIYQDELGRMWFGTEEGISIYDGNKTITLSAPKEEKEINNLLGNHINSIAGDNKSNVFIQASGALIKYNLITEKFNIVRASKTGIVCENKGEVWTAISDSIFTWNKENESFEYRFSLPRNKLNVTAIKTDIGNRCWVGTSSGLFVRDNEGIWTNIIKDVDIFTLFEDSKHNLWISSRMNGLYHRDIQGNMTHYVYEPTNPHTIASNQIRGFAEDNYGNIWIGTFQGLNKYNPVSKRFDVFKRDAKPGSLKHSSVFPIYRDQQGTIWLGTYYGGAHYFNPETDLFTVYTDSPYGKDGLSYNYVGHMVEDKNNNVWICTEGGGLNFFDRKTKKFTWFMRKEGEKGNAIAHNNLKDIQYSNKYNKLYIGTHTGGLSIFDLNTMTFKNPFFEDTSFQKLAGDRVRKMRIYEDNLIFTTSVGIYKMNLSTEEIFPLFDNYTDFVNGGFTVDKSGYLWVPTNNGVCRINLSNAKDKTIYSLGKKGLGRKNIYDIIEDRRGYIFMATLGEGLYCYDSHKDRFINYNTDNSYIASNYCYDLAISTLNQIIIVGDKGLTFFDHAHKSFRIVERGTALPLDAINAGCGILVCKNGEIFMGGTNGMVTFFEQQLLNASKEYELYFSDLYVNNEHIRANDDTKILKESISFIDKIKLKHNQNNLKFTFTTNNYITPLKKVLYEYRLEGFDEEWIKSSETSVAYSNLNPGKYRLEVRELIYNYQPKMPQIISLDINILSPWYATTWAYIFYLILFGSLLYSFYRFKKYKLRMQHSLEMERTEKVSIEKLNHAKLQFFANISHEFRTPLTLILSQIELLLQNGSLSPMVYNKLLRVYKNSAQMKGLINELLDFRKLEQGFTKLKVRECDIVEFGEEIYASFSEYAKSKDITYSFRADPKYILCWFDPRQMQKVIYNLLSNAFKYTHPHGTIEMVVEGSDEAVEIKVIDNGIGIAKEHLPKIFDRFYQVSSTSTDKESVKGSGIGLALTKNLMELHRGTISVESSPEYGTIFIVTLKKGKAHFKEEEIDINPTEVVDMENFQAERFTEKMEDPENEMEESDILPEEAAKILIVEDNEEILQILTTLFSPAFQVVTASNGKDGWDKAKTSLPNLIVSDIMMPEMSGTELCRKIKADFETCHIPVVLLTALSSPDQSIEGLKRGADDYISKPFNAKVLYARCTSLLRNRVILQKKFSEQKDFDSNTLATNPLDQKFLDQINKIIEKNLDNQDFDVNIMAKELCLSRSSLYTKFKALTGMTPNDYILNFKLKKAAFMLENNPELQIGDISDRLGFGSPRYFTRCFKAQFDITPADYRKK